MGRRPGVYHYIMLRPLACADVGCHWTQDHPTTRSEPVNPKDVILSGLYMVGPDGHHIAFANPKRVGFSVVFAHDTKQNPRRLLLATPSPPRVRSQVDFGLFFSYCGCEELQEREDLRMPSLSL